MGVLEATLDADLDEEQLLFKETGIYSLQYLDPPKYV